MVTEDFKLSANSAGRIVGLKETRKKFQQMSGERNLFDKWMKEAAMVVAREAVKLAPVESGRLAMSIKGWASKSITIKSRTGGTPQKRFAYGGVITAGTPARAPYGRSTSYGMRHTEGHPSVKGNRVWRSTVVGKQNSYMVKARENKRSYMITMLNYKLAKYIKEKGFSTNGLR